ncbi:MAG: hypothetical protein SP1CHLAM54_05440 [Chlamydiia bacterium]|nr:hypothetical protein [Chlamydiia bacterium]MCH9615454.1 hypothetical protein [Chlamydiia bacterium]MCH9629109.1 hypothetical protein [Chlamydiia bacterium]
MKIDLKIYQKQFALESAQFVRIDHTDTIIAEVYKVDTEEKSFILKVCPNEEDYFREVYFLRQLENSLPLPKVIAVFKPSQNHFGAILMEYLEGDLLKEDTWSHDLAFEIGIHLAKLHNHRTKTYGDLTKPQPPLKSDTYFNIKFEEELNECQGHLPANLVKNCTSYLSHHQDLLKRVDGPCIVHRDFRPGNMIISNGKLQGIIDWSGARSGFAEQDFCSLEHFKWIPNSEYKNALLDGYSSIRPLPNYLPIMPLLQLGRALAVVGYTIKSVTWNSQNAGLYQFNRKFLDNFSFN